MKSTTNIPDRDRDASRWRSVAYVWGWFRTRFREWDRGKRNFVRGTLLGCLITAFMSAGLLLALPTFGGRERSAFMTFELSFQPSAVLGTHGLIYVGAEDGTIASFDPDTGHKRDVVDIEHPVDHLAASGDEIFAASEEAITRISPGLAAHRTVAVDLGSVPTSIQDLAAGPSGLWVLIDGGAYLAHLVGTRMSVDASVRLPEAGSSIAVTNGGVWVLSVRHRAVMLVRRVSHRWLTTLVVLGCHPTAMTTEHDHAYVLCRYARRALVLTDTHAAILSSHSTGAEGTAIGLGNNSQWILESSGDQVRQYADRTGKEVGEPVGTGREACGLAVYEGAVWIAESDSTLTRIGMEALAAERRAARGGGIALFKARVKLLVALLFGVIIVGLLTLLAAFRGNLNNPFPRYFPSSQIVLYAVNKALYEPIASSPIVGEVTTVGGGAAVGKSVVRLAAKRQTEKQRAPEVLDAAASRTIRRLYNDGKLYSGAQFLPGYRHRGLRWRPAPPVSEAHLQRAWKPIADESALCLFPGIECSVSDQPGQGKLWLELDYFVDRIAGEWRRIPRPDGATLRVALDLADLTHVGRARLRAGQRVVVDVLAQALPYELGAEPELDLILAWFPVKRPALRLPGAAPRRAV
jgi:outer membrane protein assembly factor BamB